MSINIEAIHIGNQIKEKLRVLKITQAEFAKMLGMEQPSVNAMLKKSSMDTDKLKNISILLDYNFFEDFCPDLKKKNEEQNSNSDNVTILFVEKLMDKNDRLIDKNEKLNQRITELEKEITYLSFQLKQYTNIEKEKAAV